MLGGWQKPNLFMQKEQGLFFFLGGEGGGGGLFYILGY